MRVFKEGKVVKIRQNYPRNPTNFKYSIAKNVVFCPTVQSALIQIISIDPL